MKAAVILPIFGAFLMIGIAATTTLNGRIDRVEDKGEKRLERIEVKVDDLNREMGEVRTELEEGFKRIEEKLD